MTLLPIAVLISGGGTTLKNLLELRDSGKLDVDFRLVISSRSDAKGLLFAEQAKIPTLIAPKRKSQSAEQHSESVLVRSESRVQSLLLWVVTCSMF